MNTSVIAAEGAAILITRLICKIRGHTMTHHDYGAGRRPSIIAISCGRCGGELSLRVMERRTEATQPEGVM